MAALQTAPPCSSQYGATSVQPPPKSRRVGARATRARDTPPLPAYRFFFAAGLLLPAGFLDAAFAPAFAPDFPAALDALPFAAVLPAALAGLLAADLAGAFAAGLATTFGAGFAGAATAGLGGAT